ncbi:hypothetical protein CVO76_06140 [Arthrobacter agilis]|uniref:Uncharacterized protein n=1 Tax=Arthrobacter agilis TaxID=37921 RepID=A0A2L0UDI4_9MICC|nr:hypothetical protein [Arthrobacter agilis]AUZ87262.1 hypothetical protein CVO76_06140 [Arthrobacter agilis]
MTPGTGFLPTDLHIVSETDLLLLQRRTAPSAPLHRAVRTPSSPWPAGALDAVLDELERREVCPARQADGARCG